MSHQEQWPCPVLGTERGLCHSDLSPMARDRGQAVPLHRSLDEAKEGESVQLCAKTICLSSP